MAGKTKVFRFIEEPPKRSMRRQSPASAPRLFQWLIENEYGEYVTTVGRGGIGSSNDSSGTGRLGSGKKKKREKNVF